MPFTDMPVELAPQAGETVAEWHARIAAYDTANPGVLTKVNAAALNALEDSIAAKQATSAKGQANGYAGLDGSALVPLTQLPSIPASKVAADVATQAEIDAIAAAKANTAHGHAIADTTGLQAALDAKLDDSQRAAANGVAPLDADGKVPSANLPSAESGSGVPDVTNAGSQSSNYAWDVDGSQNARLRITLGASLTISTTGVPSAWTDLVIAATASGADRVLTVPGGGTVTIPSGQTKYVTGVSPDGTAQAFFEVGAEGGTALTDISDALVVTQAEYDGLTPAADVLYLIVG